jgi:hypothetical protein
LVHVGVHGDYRAPGILVQAAALESGDPLYDLDMASYSLVKSFGGRLGPLGAAHPEAPWDRSRLGTTYPGMPWEPKESFRAVADFYTAHTPPSP